LGGASNSIAEVESGHVESSLLGACDHSVRSFVVSFGYRTLTYRSDRIASIEWFTPMLIDIANTAAGRSLDLHISVFVTCLCNQEAVPRMPNSDVTMVRPSVHSLPNNLLTIPGSSSSNSVSVDIEEDAGEKLYQSPKLNWVGLGGGVAVCGPETLTREAHNAVVRIEMRKGVGLRGIALHKELFSL
jgi:ferric-chelate reductase